MRSLLRPVHSRGVAIAGLIALVPIAILLLKGRLDVPAAAERAAIVLGVLMVLDRVGIPLVMAVLTSGRPKEKNRDLNMDDEAAGAPAEAGRPSAAGP
jgi:hypothetical protein